MDEALRSSARQARAQIERGRLRGGSLLDALLAVPFLDRDAWIDAVLGFELPPPDIELPAGAVPYLPSGVDEIVAMVREVPVGSDELLVDLGSGLGRVVILAHLLSGARALGIEIQPHLVHSARTRCAELGLPRVAFEQANAADTELDGSIFYLYAPCNGAMLERLVRQLEAVARRHPIVVCTVGLELRDVPWLAPRATRSVALSIYDSRV